MKSLRSLANRLAIAAIFVGCGGARLQNSADSGNQSGRPSSTAQPQQPALPWIYDDAPRAFAEARRTGKPVFVDVGAAWCHTCNAMGAFVLTDPKVMQLRDEAIWLQIDVDRTQNAPFLDAHSPPALPTFLTFASDGAPGSQWVGSLDANDVTKMIRGAEAGDHRVAKQIDAQLHGQLDACINVADEEPTAKEPWVLLNLRATALACATEAMALPPPRDGNRPPAYDVARLVRETERAILLAHDAPESEQRVHGDDVSSAYQAIVEAAPPVIATNVARAWYTFLEERVAKAQNAEERRAFEAHQVEAYLAANEPRRALPLLERAIRERPNDFNPRARLARVDLVLERPQAALHEVNEALRLGYGPRLVRIYELKFKIERTQQNSVSQATLREAIERCDPLPLALSTRAKVDAWKLQLAEGAQKK